MIPEQETAKAVPAAPAAGPGGSRADLVKQAQHPAIAGNKSKAVFPAGYYTVLFKCLSTKMTFFYGCAILKTKSKKLEEWKNDG